MIININTNSMHFLSVEFCLFNHDIKPYVPYSGYYGGQLIFLVCLFCQDVLFSLQAIATFGMSHNVPAHYKQLAKCRIINRGGEYWKYELGKLFFA